MNVSKYFCIPHSYSTPNDHYIPMDYPFQPLVFSGIIYSSLLKYIRSCHPSAQKPIVIYSVSLNKSQSSCNGLSDLDPCHPKTHALLPSSPSLCSSCTGLMEHHWHITMSETFDLSSRMLFFLHTCIVHSFTSFRVLLTYYLSDVFPAFVGEKTLPPQRMSL